MLNTLEEAVTLVKKAKEELANARMILARHDINAIKSESYKLLEEAAKNFTTFLFTVKKEA